MSGAINKRYTIWFKAVGLLLFCFLAHPLWAQYYKLGQDPSALRWRQINTDHFRIIYPSDYENKAQDAANLFEYVYSSGTKTLEYFPRKLPVIIHNRDIVPNAFSIWAPRRIELFTCPPQNNYAQVWLEQLAIHEYRHVVQMDVLNKGFTKGLSWLFGEQATAAITGLFVPMWFMEGDAVCTETTLSHSGRGRVPSFEMEIRTQMMQKGRYTYDKAVFGSFRDFVPDHYVLGYQIVANTRKNIGYKAWTQTLAWVARKPYLMAPFSMGLKKATGFNKVHLYQRTFDELDSLWRWQAGLVSRTEFKAISCLKNKHHTRYKYPHYITDSLIVAERTGMDDISRFVLVDRQGNEKILCTPGFFSSDVFSVNIGTGALIGQTNKPGSFTVDNISISNGLLAWTERVADPRWQNRSYSVIRLYDFQSGKIRNLTRKSRYFAPAISPDSKSILAVKVTETDEASLVLIDLDSGMETKKLLPSHSHFYMNPSWSNDGKKIVFTSLDQHGKKISEMNLESGAVQSLTEPGFTEISNPVFAGRFILFNGSYSGIENIFAIDTASREIFQVTSSEFGACNARYNSTIQRFIYSDYQSSGYRIVEAEFLPSSWKPLNQVHDHSPALYKSLILEESGIVDSTTRTHIRYESQPYRKALHLFNFHSWAPLYFNYDTGETGTGISLMSQNLLSTATTIVGYDWDYAGKTGKYKMSFLWEGWYPVLSLEISHGKQAFTREESDQARVRHTRDETMVSGGVRLPLLFNHGKYYSGAQAAVNTAWMKIRNNTDADTAKLEGILNTLNYSFLVYNYHKQSLRDVYPLWGQVLKGNFRHSPFGDRSFGNLLSLESTLFFPGILNHSGFRIYGGYQHRIRGDYAYNDLISMPRGYLRTENDQLLSLGISYKVPVLYPDLSIGPVAYIKRIKAAAFYDQAFLTRDEQTSRLNSAGIELTSDLHILRFLLPFDLGFRTGYRFDDKKWFIDFLFSVNLSF